MIEDKATEAAKSMARKAYQEFYEDLRNFTRTTISEYIRPQVTLSQGRVEAFSQGGIRIDWPDLEMDLAKPGPSVQMARILESTDAANVLLQAMRSEGETDLNLTSKTEILLMHARQAENLAKDATPPMEASDTITDYYESIADLQVISGELKRLSDEVSGAPKGLWNRIQGMWDTIKAAVSSIENRISGLVSTAARKVLEALDNLRSAIGKGLQMVGGSVDALAHRIYRLVISLIRRMFDFAADVSSEANKKGFVFKELSLEFPTFEFDFLKLATFSIPIPKSIIPKLTVTFRSSTEPIPTTPSPAGGPQK